MPRVNESSQASAGTWTSTQAYVMAVVCLLIGVAVGYFVRGSAAPSAAGPAPSAATEAGMPAGMGGGQPSPEQMKMMADKQAEPLLAQLKSDPNNASTLAEIGNVYYDTKIYKEAIDYYERALKIDPKNPNVRTDMGTAYFYAGDPDRAITEFESVLKADPKHGQTYFNLGMVKWQGKNDVNGAVAAWQTLLKNVPDYPERARVEQLIQKAKEHSNMPAGTKTNKPATM